MQLLRATKNIHVFTLVAFFLFTAFNTTAQVSNYELSDPINFSEKGNDNLLQMRNGNTFWFHFENRKAISLTVFNKERKIAAVKKYVCDYFDINELDNASFLGTYDINNEVVLFVQQAYLNREALIRFRFNAEDGKLIEEKIVERAPGFNAPIEYHVVQQPDREGYAVFYFRNPARHPGAITELFVYNNRHEVIHHASMSLTNDDMTDLSFHRLRAEKGSYYCLLEMQTTDKRGQRNQSLICGQLTGTDTVFNIQVVQGGTNETVQYGLLSYNEFAQTENLLLLNTYITGKRIQGYSIYKRNCLSYFCPFTVAGFRLQQVKPLQTDRLQQIMYAHISPDTVNNVLLYPEAMYTNKFGATLILYQEQGFIDRKTKTDYNKMFRGNIGISILDDDGNEIFADVIPQKQHVFYENNTRFWNYVTRAAGFDCIPVGGKYYLFMNIHKNNIDKKIGAELTPVENLYHSNTVCYVLDRKNQLNKAYLFGNTEVDEDNCSLLTTGNYNIYTNTYAVLMCHRKGDKSETHVAWCALQP